jgi:hypothetical protein
MGKVGSEWVETHPDPWWLPPPCVDDRAACTLTDTSDIYTCENHGLHCTLV